MGDELLPLDCASGVATGANQRLHIAQKAVGGWAHLWLVNGVSAIGQRLWVIARNIGDFYLSGNDPYHGQAVGIIFNPSPLFKHPLSLKGHFSCSLNQNSDFHGRPPIIFIAQIWSRLYSSSQWSNFIESAQVIVVRPSSESHTSTSWGSRNRISRSEWVAIISWVRWAASLITWANNRNKLLCS